MDYRSRKISIRSERIKNLMRKLDEGRFLIPTFQRPYVWDPENIIDLWHSIYECYPIGSVLYWKTRTYLHVHRRLGGFYLPGNGDEGDACRSYILDGQQRITSLYVSFQGGAGKIREKHDFDFTLYFDLKNEVFFFENEYYRHRWDVDAALLLRLKDVPDLPPDYCRHLPGVSPDIEKNLDQLRYIFTDYSVPVICLEGYDISSVCAVFERINQNGVKLDNLDILIARSFENCDTVVEEDFPIK
ncbi:MAG: DUF262 domain-containing protein [Acidobacteria bacterium]|nr:DUF262 domain-containing protein [Acidobacteriota bacterium]